MKILSSIFSLMFFATPAFAVSEKFDLICNGQEVSELNGIKKAPKKWLARIKIDLGSKTFCERDCNAVEEFIRITPEMLVLRKLEFQNGFDRSSIYRSTGLYTRAIAEIGSKNEAALRTIVAQCKVASFSGFPKKLF